MEGKSEENIQNEVQRDEKLKRKADYTVISNKASSAELMTEFPKLNKDINRFKKL